VQDNLVRFSGASWFDIVQQQKIILAGLGGIGSWLSILLSRLNPEHIIVYDDDRFDCTNMSGQFCRITDLDNPKVITAQAVGRDFSNYNKFSAISEKFVESSQPSNIMICGFDNMVARKTFFEVWNKRRNVVGAKERKNMLLIDGRLLAESYQIFCLRGDDTEAIKNYQTHHLFDDSIAEEPQCTLKQTSHIAAMIASKMTAYFVNFCNNMNPANFPRRIPYYTHYEAVFNLIEEVYENVGQVR
jgi:molybdopterin/thiamine biosynthesis adenylyltransferase